MTQEQRENKKNLTAFVSFSLTVP